MSYVCLWSPSWPTGADFSPELIASLLAVAPRVAVGERGLVWGDARGLHGGQLAEAMLRVAHDYGHDDVHAGTASTPTAAEVAAVYGETSLVIVKPGQDATYVAPRPLSVLSPGESLGKLVHGLGIETCGSFAALDAEAIEVRFGIEGVRLWQRARAEDERWLFKNPVRALPSASVEWVEYGLKDPERLLFVINSLAGTVCTALAQSGARAREMAVVFSLGNRTQRQHVIRSSRPSAEQKRWMRLVRESLGTLTFSDGVTGVALRVESVTGSAGTQGDLFDRGFASAPLVEQTLIELTDDQGDVVVQPENTQHPLLEQRTAWKSRGTAPEESVVMPASAERPSLTLQLLPTARVVTVQTQQRRDHDMPVRYLDGNEWHDLVDVAGPDRVSGGQWSKPYERTYFRCVREDGMMMWMYHEQAVAAAKSADWYLHGWWD